MSYVIDDPLIGRTIAQYEILARIGGGAMGIVYKAHDTKLGRHVALKFLPPQWSHDETAKQRFVREAQAASATHHPNICTIHDIERTGDGQLFIVMAFYEGVTLKQRLESGPMAIDEALDIATQIGDGLAKSHAQGVVHRDIKPGNVMLTEDGVRILDFGLATFADALKLTTENASFGTPAYMSPEQVRGQATDARSDVWAAGVVLYEMLTGHPPFRGSHIEAVGHAICHESPAPIRAERPEVPEDVEQLVFRAVHKDANIRFPSGRELSRALRQVRGLSVPLELRTQPVSVPGGLVQRRQARWKTMAATAIATVLAAAVFIGWALWPVDRTLIAIVPVINSTGYGELDDYRLALTSTIMSALRDSRTVRVIGHEQLLSIIRRFKVPGEDVASGEALRALKEHTGARALVVVTILNEGSGFHARIEFRNPERLTNDGVVDTPPLVSTLVREAAFSLVGPAVDGIDQHFVSRAPWRARVADFMRRAAGRDPGRTVFTQTLETAADFDRGLEAYQELEYVAARTAFDAAAQREPLNPVLVAWKARIARLMRRDVDAETLARQAAGLITEETAERDRLFVEAVFAEARKDGTAAGERYEKLRELYPDEPAVLMELGAFQDRQGSVPDAIATYHAALALDGRLVRPHLELCRLYNRIKQPADAREHARGAVAGYEGLGSEGGQAQALMCLTESLRVGDSAQRADALRQAQRALEIFSRLQYGYNLARAHNYVGLAHDALGNRSEAIRSWERALTASEAVGNVVLTPLVLMNLGSAQDNLGNQSAAIIYFRRSASGFELLGERASAAENQFNVGALLVLHGGNAQEGLRLIRDALEVFRDLQNSRFEISAGRVIAMYYRRAGRHEEAERELNKALSLASARNLDREHAMTSIRVAQSRLETGDYERARALLVEAKSRVSERDQMLANILLAQSLTRQGDFPASEETLARVRQSLRSGKDSSLVTAMNLALGELAYERGLAQEARTYFEAAAARLTPELPDSDALQARAFVGLLEGLAGRAERARSIVLEVLEVATRIEHIELEARCRLFLAQIEIGRRRADRALGVLRDIPEDNESRSIGPELRAEVQYWTSRAFAEKGDEVLAAHNLEASRKTIRDLADKIPEGRRAAFLRRRAVVNILG